MSKGIEILDERTVIFDISTAEGKEGFELFSRSRNYFTALQKFHAETLKFKENFLASIKEVKSVPDKVLNTDQINEKCAEKCAELVAQSFAGCLKDQGLS